MLYFFDNYSMIILDYHVGSLHYISQASNLKIDLVNYVYYDAMYANTYMWVKRKISMHTYKRQGKDGISSPKFPKIQAKGVAIYVCLILLILCKCTGTHIHV